MTEINLGLLVKIMHKQKIKSYGIFQKLLFLYFRHYLDESHFILIEDIQ